jgi:hypothetical protein
MTKGQEIAASIAGCELHSKLSANAIDAAIAEAVSKRTVECATLADSDKPIQRAILRLNSPPPATVYPFEKPCRCWEYSVPDAQAVSQSNWRRLLATHSTYVYLCPDAAYCEVCGAPRKGS